MPPAAALATRPHALCPPLPSPHALVRNPAPMPRRVPHSPTRLCQLHCHPIPFSSPPRPRSSPTRPNPGRRSMTFDSRSWSTSRTSPSTLAGAAEKPSTAHHGKRGGGGASLSAVGLEKARRGANHREPRRHPHPCASRARRSPPTAPPSPCVRILGSLGSSTRPNPPAAILAATPVHVMLMPSPPVQPQRPPPPRRPAQGM